jgi:death-on-curing protein
MSESDGPVQPKWIGRAATVALHDEQIAEHGGLAGIRDEGMLDSALARPKNRWQYEQADIIELAAAYAFGLARNHPFADGDKRTSLVVAGAFLRLNGLRIVADPADVVTVSLRLADSGSGLTEADLAAWLAGHAEPL